jgi:shikimate 5-dehydrogenase
MDLNGDALIHTTPVGMHPHAGNTLIPGEFLKKGMVVMDTIYNPLETRLLKEAKEKECIILGGVKMLVYQGVAQFELWTGQKAPVEIMEGVVLKVLTGKDQGVRTETDPNS